MTRCNRSVVVVTADIKLPSQPQRLAHHPTRRHSSALLVSLEKNPRGAARWGADLRPAKDGAFELLAADKISPGSWWSSNHPLACLGLCILLERVSEVADCDLIPNHAILRVSEPGHKVNRHTDKNPPTPAFTAMLPVFQSFGTPWEITIEKPGEQPETFAPRIGEAVIFSGYDDFHSRPPLHADKYVNAICYYRKPDDAFDYAHKMLPSDIKILADYADLILRRSYQ